MFEFCVISIYLLLNYIILRLLMTSDPQGSFESKHIFPCIIIILLGMPGVIIISPFMLKDWIKQKYALRRENRERLAREEQEARDRRRESYNQAIDQAGQGIYSPYVASGMAMLAQQQASMARAQAQHAYNQRMGQQNQLHAIQQQSNRLSGIGGNFGSISINSGNAGYMDLSPDSVYDLGMSATRMPSESSPSLECNEKEDYTGFGSWYKDSLKKDKK